MKIAIVGSHRVGKTTLFNELRKSLGVVGIEEIPRVFMNMLGWTVPSMTEDERSYFQTAVFNNQIYQEVELGKNGFISDRSIIDNLAYSQGLPVYPEMLKQAGRHLKYNKGYDHVLYTPIEFELDVDDIADPDPAFQKLIDSRVVNLLHEFGVEYHTITGSVEKRVETVLSILTK